MGCGLTGSDGDWHNWRNIAFTPTTRSFKSTNAASAETARRNFAIAHSGRYRRQQQLPLSCLENRAPVPTGELLCPCRDRCPLSHRRFQMESHRASPLLRSLSKLGRRTARLLPEDPQLCPHHPNPNRTSGHCLSRPPILSLRSQTHTRSNCFTSIAAPRNSARMELHYQAATVNLFLRDS
jgi:hypothetical protein